MSDRSQRSDTVVRTDAPTPTATTGTPTTRRSDAAAARAALARPGTRIRSGRDGSVEVLRDPHALECLRAGWGRLDADFRGPFNHLEWILAYAHALPPGERLFVITVRQGGVLTGVAPLVQRGGPLGALRLINSDDASGFFYADRPQLFRLVDAVLGLRLPLALTSLVAGSPTDELFSRLGRHRRLYVDRSWSMGPSLVLDDSYLDPLSKLRSGRRSELRRRLRKAEAIGEVRFDVEVPGDDPGRWFEEFVRIEGSGWKGRAGTALQADDAQRETLWRFITAPDARDEVRFATMRIGEAMVATDLLLLADGRLWGMKGAYDEAFAHVSPGLLLKVHLMSWAAKHRLRTFEFMGSTDGWKQAWGTGPELHAMKIYPASIAGSVALARDAVSQARRTLAEARTRVGA